VVFFATPHGVAMAQAPELLAAGVKVIDLAADFRIKDRAVFEQWYKIDTPARNCWKKRPTVWPS
jgi:N-acetyl-gamma-glutamyl-phosphate reductase